MILSPQPAFSCRAKKANSYPYGEFRMEAPREKKGKAKTKKLTNGDMLTRI